MARRTAGQELSLEAFDAWSKAGDTLDAVGQAADERGGPSLSLVPVEDQNVA